MPLLTTRRSAPIGRVEVTVSPLRTTDDLTRALNASLAGPVWILKHSEWCSISAEAFDEFRAFADSSRTDQYWVLTVQESPRLSRLVTTQLGVTHESPQVLLVWKQTVRAVVSHWAVTAAALRYARDGIG